MEFCPQHILTLWYCHCTQPSVSRVHTLVMWLFEAPCPAHENEDMSHNVQWENLGCKITVLKMCLNGDLQNHSDLGSNDWPTVFHARSFPGIVLPNAPLSQGRPVPDFTQNHHSVLPSLSLFAPLDYPGAWLSSPGVMVHPRSSWRAHQVFSGQPAVTMLSVLSLLCFVCLSELQVRDRGCSLIHTHTRACTHTHTLHSQLSPPTLRKKTWHLEGVIGLHECLCVCMCFLGIMIWIQKKKRTHLGRNRQKLPRTFRFLISDDKPMGGDGAFTWQVRKYSYFRSLLEMHPVLFLPLCGHWFPKY